MDEKIQNLKKNTGAESGADADIAENDGTKADQFTGELTTQQKIWKGTGTVLYAVRPLVLYLLLPGILITIGKGIRAPKMPLDDFIRQSGNFYLFVSIILTGVILYRFSKKRGLNFWEETTCDLHNPDLRFGGICFLLGVSSAMFLSSVLTLIPKGLLTGYRSVSGQWMNTADYPLLVLMVLIITPLLEESLFRGYMLGRLLRFFSVRTSVLIVNTIFALMHGNIFWMLYTFFLSWLLCDIAIKKENILYPAFLHAGFNFPALLTVSIEKLGGTELFYGNKFLIAGYGLIGVLSLLLLLDRMKKRGEDL